MSSKLIKQDDSYRNWIQEVSKRFRQSQLKAAIKVNSEMLRFYWMLGKDISSMRLDAKYGTGFYQSVSSDLQEFFPDVRSFSVTNLKYMRYFYELYSNIENHPQLGDDLKASSQPMGISEYDISHFMPENYRSSLPTIEEIEAELAGGQNV